MIFFAEGGVPPRSMWNKCFGHRKRTTIVGTGCWGLAKTPRGRSAALSGELGGARNVPRNRAGKCRDAAGARTVCAAAGARWEDERRLQPPCGCILALLQIWISGLLYPTIELK